jgi:phosphoribosylformylglycinamidine synthase
VFPTPTIGMIGILEDKKFQTGLSFKNEGDLIYLIGKQVNDIASSEYVYSFLKIKNTPAPYFNLEEEYILQKGIAAIIRKGLINSAHDISDGGLFITLFESAMDKNLGFEIKANPAIRKDAYLFGEAQSRAVISISPANRSDFESELKASGIVFENIGTVKGNSAIIDGTNYGSIKEFANLYDTSIESKLN